MESLKGKVALVTGSAHRVGKGIALALAEQGVHQVVHYGSSADEAEQTRQAVEAHDVRAITHSTDLSDPAAIGELFAVLEAEFGRLDILVNSAARFDRGPFDAISVEDWDRSMAVNLRAPFLCMQHAARLMTEGGLIVNIADNSGVHPWENFTQHGVSKAALLHLTRIGARVLAPAIRVNALVLGPIIPTQGVDEDSERWQNAIEWLPLARSGSVEGIGAMVCQLAVTDFITGSLIHMDSGEDLLGPGRN
ncbi:MAG: SDR family oxidoreductase [Chloroflexi bacterium]|nr:SDR family oxidoreductase [Chloroflexota bacterium]